MAGKVITILSGKNNTTMTRDITPSKDRQNWIYPDEERLIGSICRHHAVRKCLLSLSEQTRGMSILEFCNHVS